MLNIWSGMKYEKLRKRSRNEAVIKYRKDNPDISFREIAEVFKISRQRVFQIVKKIKE